MAPNTALRRTHGRTLAFTKAPKLSAPCMRRLRASTRAAQLGLLVAGARAMSSLARSPAEVREATRATLADYGAVAPAYAAGNMDHDVSQNIEALLAPLRSRAAPLDLLDVCCASGRDLVALTKRGHRAVGLDGVPAFCEMARELSGCEVWEQDLAELDLPAERFDGIFANACLFHLPSAALPAALDTLRAALRPGGVLFVSNAHGFGEDKEGWTQGRVEGGARYVCWQSEGTWCATMQTAGFVELDRYYRPAGQPRERQPWFATVWRKGP